MERLRKQIGIRRPVALFVAPQTPWPFTIGVFRPKLIVPRSLLTDSSPAQTKAVLIHELAHVHRFDCAVAMLENAVVLLFWWIPFIYNIRSTLLNAREEICDAFVLGYSGDGESLAEYLIQSVERAANARLAWGVGLSADEPQIVEQRVTHLLFGDKQQMLRINSLQSSLIVTLALAISIGLVFVNYAQAQFVIGTPVNFGPALNTEYNEHGPVLSNDGLTLYFASDRRNPSIEADIYTSSRISLVSAWSPPESFTPAGTSDFEHHPFISNDGLTFLYNSGFISGGGLDTIYGLSRDTIEDPWGPRFALPAPINDGVSHSRTAKMSPDRLTLIFSSTRAGGQGDSDIWEAVRPSLNDPWSVHVLGPNVNTPVHEINPVMSSDGLTLLFGSQQIGGEGDYDIWMSTRDAIGDEWGPASNLGPTVNTATPDRPSNLWEPGNLLLFRSNGHGGAGLTDMFYVSVIPEPSTVAMSIAGSLLLVGFVSRRRLRSFR